MTTITHKAVREADGQTITLYEHIEQVSDGLGGSIPGLRSMRDAKGHPYNVVKPASERRFIHYATQEIVRLVD